VTACTATAVLWCHGGPGSRLEPAHLAPEAREAGLRIIGIDRPGYGLSTPQPGRTIAGWVPEALAISDHLGIEQFVTVGTSTGGAFALAVAALAPERVLAVVACCSMTDMHGPEGRSTMSQPHTHAVWDGLNRVASLAAAIEAHGEGGGKVRGGGMVGALTPSDLALFRDPGLMKDATAAFPAKFAQGLDGYTEDRLADGPGSVTCDFASIQFQSLSSTGEATAWSTSSTPITPLNSSRTRNWSLSITPVQATSSGAVSRILKSANAILADGYACSRMARPVYRARVP